MFIFNAIKLKKNQYTFTRPFTNRIGHLIDNRSFNLYLHSFKLNIKSGTIEDIYCLKMYYFSINLLFYFYIKMYQPSMFPVIIRLDSVVSLGLL